MERHGYVCLYVCLSVCPTDAGYKRRRFSPVISGVVEGKANKALITRIPGEKNHVKDVEVS